jgi:transposase-like protein/predicted DNA-binding protein YlxM (UPF0122 family)
MPSRKFTDEQERQIRAEYESGLSCRALSDKYHVPSFTVLNAIRRAGGTTRPLGDALRILTKEQETSIRSAYEAGAGRMDLAAQYGVSRWAISEAIKRAGGVLVNRSIGGSTSKLDEPEFKAAILKLYADGSGVYQIARTIGVCAATARKFLKRHGLEIRRAARLSPPIPEKRPCTICKQIKPVSAFFIRRNNRPESRCRLCKQALSAKYYCANRESEIRRAVAGNAVRNAALKDEAFAAYGNQCSCCGETIKAFLTLDHVFDDGNEHRKVAGNTYGVYRWLKANGWPTDRFRLLCVNCNFGRCRYTCCPHLFKPGEGVLRLPPSNPQRESSFRARNNVRVETFAAYGGKCVCCGEVREEFLTIDHLLNDGNADRVAGIGSGTNFYRHLKKLGFPKDRYALACYNCNVGRQYAGGVCPHISGV